MTTYALGLQEVDGSMGAIVGGKGAALGALMRIDGVRVPAGFCVTTAAFRAVAVGIDHATPRRAAIDAAPVPPAIVEAITGALAALGDHAYAVRSSATAEDLPTASFAGQHDSFLNVRGLDDVLACVRRCWASLWSDRAVAYRAQHRIEAVEMAVVVQRMVAPQVAGVLFTADPISGHRAVSVVEAIAGLGEALVAGTVTPDRYRVRAGEILEGPASGALTAAQLVALEQLGRRIEAHLGAPQDIEWCLADGAFAVVQSRPITTLYPVPVVDDEAPHVYVSVGHQQMMTDAMRPLGLSFWLMTTPAPMRVAGSRLFVDIAPLLASAGRDAVIATMGQADPLIGSALAAIVARGFIAPLTSAATPGPVFGPPPQVTADPAIVRDLVARSQASINAMRDAIAPLSGPALYEFIRADLPELKRHLFDPGGRDAILAAIGAAAWLNTSVESWLGDRNVADVLARSAPDNPTAEMGLALLDVADAIRPHAAVVAYLRTADDATFLDGLADVEGGAQARAALEAFLDRYGARAAGEIDLTRPRWRETPTALVPLVLGNVAAFAPGERARRIARGVQEAEAMERSLVARVRQLPDGDARAESIEQRIRILRTFIGYREYPKFGMVQRYAAYRDAIRRDAMRLVHEQVIRTVDDIDFLTFAELEAIACGSAFDPALVDARRAAFAHDQRLTPPRVMTGEGEIVTGAYARDVPFGALPGLAVSTGVIEGRARVVARMDDATLEPGDILVTAFTDPSWTPMFVAIAGLVTEVGGLMTHGAVIAREYGLPAVVGVIGATTRIADGQRIRVNGTEGYVELLGGPG